jgi:hypothetical protein
MADPDLSALSREEFRRVVQGLQQEQPQQGGFDAGALPPDTARAFDAASQVTATRPDPNFVSPEGQRMGVRPGAFLDIESGAGAGTRAQLGLDPNQLNQLKLLNSLYGEGRVDISDEGRFIIRGQGPEGPDATTDLMVDPIGVDKGDVAEAGAQILPMVAGGLVARYGGRVGQSGVTKAISAIGGMALAQEATGGIQDSFVRWLRDNEQDLPEIGKRRAKMAVADAALGLLFAGATKAAVTSAEGLLGLAQVPNKGGAFLRTVPETAVEKSARALKESTGVDYKLTPGELTGSKLLMRLEAMAAGRPGSATAIDRYRAFQQKAEDELRRIFLGLPRTMPEEQLAAALPEAEVTGAVALRRVGREANRLEGNVETARTAVQRAGTTEAQQVAGVDLANPINVSDVGQALRARTTREFAQGRADFSSRYDTFLAKPEIQARTVAGDDIAKAARQVEKDFVPAADRGGTTESLEAFVQAKFRSKLDTLKSLKGATVSINDLKRIRTDIDNSIKEGIAIPGTDVAQLESLRGVVDDNITQALQGMPNKTLLGEWQGLKTDYRAFQKRFNRVGVREMLVPEGETGSIGNARLAESITGNSPEALDRYNAFKDFFGANSPEFAQLQQVAKQDALFGSMDDLTGFVDGAKLRSRLTNIRPEIAQELFGVSKTELTRIGETLKQVSGRIDTEELRALAARGLTANELPRLIVAEEARAAAFNNKLIRAASKGMLGAESIEPSDFVRYAYKMDEPNVARIMGILADQPFTVQEIRQLGIEDIWAKARATSASGLISSKSLEKALGDPAQQRTWATILGRDTLDGLKRLAEVTEPREFAASTYRGAGQLAGASDVKEIFMKGEVGAIREAASNFLLAFLYSGPARKLVTNLATSSDRSRLLNGVIASTPFIEAVAARFGKEGAPMVMGALRDTVEPLQRKELFIEGQIKEGDPASLSREEFQRWIGNTGPKPGRTAPRP